jgi:hypothetical protein
MVAANSAIGHVVALWRYPVKSMLGEELHAADVTARGLVGDRGYALLDATTGMVASAKNPRKWAALFDCRGVYPVAPQPGVQLPPVRITLPDGATLGSEEPDAARRLSQLFGREVHLASAAPDRPSLEEYWPDIEGLAHRETVTDERMPAQTFFDAAVVHVLTTATLDRLPEVYPAGRFDVRRFRPNLVVQTRPARTEFVENEWVGHRLAVGDDVRLRVTGPCARCVMTTLPQGDLPRDPGILRAAAQHNQARVGVYAAVERGGRVKRGDPVRRI